MNIMEALFRDTLHVSAREDDREAVFALIEKKHQKLLRRLEKLPDSKEAKQLLHQMMTIQKNVSKGISMK